MIRIKTWKTILVFVVFFTSLTAFFQVGVAKAHNGKHLIKDTESKTLHFTKTPDSNGLSTYQKIKGGCPITLAGVLAEWSKYSPEGFNFSPEAEEAVLNAIIRIVGIGMEDIFVCVHETETSSGILQKELNKLV
jgi:hypothetical protein